MSNITPDAAVDHNDIELDSITTAPVAGLTPAEIQAKTNAADQLQSVSLSGSNLNFDNSMGGGSTGPGSPDKLDRSSELYESKPLRHSRRNDRMRKRDQFMY